MGMTKVLQYRQNFKFGISVFFDVSLLPEPENGSIQNVRLCTLNAKLPENRSAEFFSEVVLLNPTKNIFGS